MSGGVDGKAVDHLLHREVLQLPIVVCVRFLNDLDEATGTGGIDSSQAWVEFHNVGSCRQRELRDRLVSVQSKDSERFGSPAQKKCPMLLGVDCHSVVVTAAFDGISPNHGVGGRIDFGNFVGVPEIYVYLAAHRVILRHAGFAFEFDCFYDFVFFHVDNRDGFSERIGNVHLVKRCGVGAAVGLGSRGKPLGDAMLRSSTTPIFSSPQSEV